MLHEDLVEHVWALRAAGTDLARVEAKRANRELPKSVRETLSAFSNTPGGGVLILGLNEAEGFAAAGVAEAKKVRDAFADLARTQMEPPLTPLIEIMAFEGAQLVVAEVAEVDRSVKPCYYKGAGLTNGAFIRVGDGHYRLGPAEVHAMVAGRGQPVDDAQPVEGAGADDLVPEIVEPFLRRLRIERPYAYRDLGDRALLLATRVLVPGAAGPVPSLAGLLCFGRLPQHLYPQLEITFVEYPTVEGADLGTGTRFLDNKTFDGPIPLLVRETLLQLARTVRRRTIVSPDGGAAATYEYPIEALREAVVNAVVHRDLGPYSLGTQVQVEAYPDRITVRNPGGLFGAVRLDTLGEPGLSSSRNALLLKLLEDVEIPGEGRTVCENRASGIRTMIRAMKAAGLPPPQFADHVSWFEVTLAGPPAALPGFPHPPALRAGAVAGGPGRTDDDTVHSAARYHTAPHGPGERRFLDPRGRAQLVLGALAEETLSRREIEAATGLSHHHVRAALTDLIGRGVVAAAGPARSPARRYSITARPELGVPE